MNRLKAPMSAPRAKQKDKEVRKASASRSSQNRDPEIAALTEKELSKRYPRKKKTSLAAAKAKIVAKKKKAPQHNTSKRTTPSTTQVESPPAHAHKEGLRWIKTITEQCRMQRKKLQKKMSKKPK